MTSPARWGFAISLPRGVSALNAVRLALQRAGVSAAGIEIDAERRSVLAHVEGDTDWWAIWRDVTREMQPETWTVVLERPAPITETDPPPPAEWWRALRAGAKVRPRANGTAVLYASGQLWRRYDLVYGDGTPVVWTVWAPAVDAERRRACVYAGDETRYPGGLWVSVDDVEPAE